MLIALGFLTLGDLFGLGFVIGGTITFNALKDLLDNDYDSSYCDKSYLNSYTDNYSSNNNYSDVATTVVSNTNKDTNKDSNYDKTYKYWSSLSYEEQEKYFDDNIYLRDYKDELLYNSRSSTAKKVAELSEKIGKDFDNKYNTYF